MITLSAPQLTAGPFQERASLFLRKAAELATQWYDASGVWQGIGTPREPREHFWLAPALLRWGSAPHGNAVVREGARRVKRYGERRYDVFASNIAVSLLVQEAALDHETRSELLQLVREAISGKPGSTQADFRFMGFNDNMPAKCTMGLILGGELLGDKEAVEHGLWNLHDFRAQLVRCGINSEFNSPTYSPLTIRALSEVAEYAQNSEARQLARALEERLWIDLAARFHPEMRVLCGPGSRCYSVDNVAHLSCAAMLFWFLLGDRAQPSPMELFDPDCPLLLHHCGSVPFNVHQAAYLATGEYHLPEVAMELLHGKSYPFTAHASFENGPRGRIFPATVGNITTRLEADFAIGSASFLYAPGMSNSGSLAYQVTYRQDSEVRSCRDRGTIFHRTLCDDEPGLIGEEGPYRGEADYLPNWGRCITAEVERTVVVLTQPHREVAQRMVGRCEDAVVFSSHFHGADEVIVGGARRSEWGGEAAPGEWIVCRRGRLYVGIRPLGYSHAWGRAKVRLRKNGAYEWISIALYDGERRRLLEEELALCFGGFLAEHASVDDYPDLETFAASLASGRFTDYFWSLRWFRYQREGLDLDLAWDPQSLHPRHCIVNGKPRESHRVAIDGVSSDDLPFIREGGAATPVGFPWSDLRVGWLGDDGDLSAFPSAIGDWS